MVDPARSNARRTPSRRSSEWARECRLISLVDIMDWDSQRLTGGALSFDRAGSSVDLRRLSVCTLRVLGLNASAESLTLSLGVFGFRQIGRGD